MGLKPPPPKETELSAKPTIDAELFTLRSEFETSSATYEREIEGLKQLESLLDKQGRKPASLPSSHVPASSTDGRATLNAPVSTPDQHVTLDHELLPRDRLPTWAPARDTARDTARDHELLPRDRLPTWAPVPNPVPVRWSEMDQSRTDHTHRSKERGKEPLGQAALAPVEPLGLDGCMQVLTTAPRPALHVEPLGLDRWKEERDALDTALGRLVGRRCTDAELAQALELLLAREETDGAPLPSTPTATTPATPTLPANPPAPPLPEIQPEIMSDPPPESADSRVPRKTRELQRRLSGYRGVFSSAPGTAPEVPRKTREVQRRLSGYRGVFSSAPGTAPDPKLEHRAALATALATKPTTALDTKPEGVKRAANLGLFSRVVASWGHRGYRGGLRRDRDAARDSIRDTARAAPRGGGYTGGFSRGMMLEASSAEAEAEAEAEATKAAKAAKAAELPARAEIQAEIQSETLAATHAAVPEGEAPPPATPPATPLRALSAPASHVTASHVTASHGASDGGGTSLHNQMHSPRGLQLLALRPAEVVCLDDDGLPMRIVWDEAGHPIRSPIAAVGTGAPSSLSIVREDVGGAGRISTDAEADMLLPRSPSRLCLDFLSDALVSLPRSPSRLQLDDDVDGVAAAAGAGVHEVASKAWSAILGVWRALARSVLHADADTSVGTVADAEAGSVIAPADGPQRIPLGTADKLRGAALDLVLGRFARRLLNLGLSRAFDSWAEHWRERTYAMARVRACTSRVALQQLADAFGFWARPPFTFTFTFTAVALQQLADAFGFWARPPFTFTFTFTAVALQQLADAFGFWARPPEWVWKSLEYDDEVRNQGRDTISHVDRKMCLGLCLIWMPRIVPYLDASDCAWPMRASIATLFCAHAPIASPHIIPTCPMQMWKAFENVHRAQRWRQERRMRRAWTSWELRRQMDRNPRGKWMQSWMTVTLHQLLCAHREIEEIHLRRSCMRRGWRSLITEWSRRIREVKPTFSAIFKWLRPLEKSPEARQKMTDAPNKERALQRTLESSLRAKHERISAMVAAAAAKRAVDGLQVELPRTKPPETSPEVLSGEVFSGDSPPAGLPMKEHPGKHPENHPESFKEASPPSLPSANGPSPAAHVVSASTASALSTASSSEGRGDLERRLWRSRDIIRDTPSSSSEVRGDLERGAADRELSPNSMGGATTCPAPARPLPVLDEVTHEGNDVRQAGALSTALDTGSLSTTLNEALSTTLSIGALSTTLSTGAQPHQLSKRVMMGERSRRPSSADEGCNQRSSERSRRPSSAVEDEVTRLMMAGEGSSAAPLEGNTRGQQAEATVAPVRSTSQLGTSQLGMYRYLKHASAYVFGRAGAHHGATGASTPASSSSLALGPGASQRVPSTPVTTPASAPLGVKREPVKTPGAAPGMPGSIANSMALERARARTKKLKGSAKEEHERLTVLAI